MQVTFIVKLALYTLMMMIFIIPQSFFELKIPFLGVIITWLLVEGFRCQWKIKSVEFLHYYLIFCLLSTIWCLIGLARGNENISIIESNRVYVYYMIIYSLLTIYVSNIYYQSYIDGVVIYGALGIGFVALITLFDQTLQLNIIPQFIKDDMYLQLGIHDGYLQMNNVNIGMLTFIAPYLLSRLLLSERTNRHPYLILGLVVAVASAILASRRAVLVILIIVPLLVLVINFLSGQPTSYYLRRRIQAYLLLLLTAVVGVGMLTYLEINYLDGFVGRLMEAFNSDTDGPRSLQHAALMTGFSDNFFWGSGFGGITEVIRSDERPWTFELTYSRLLFNGGVIGFGLLLLFFLVYLLLVMRKIRQSAHAPVYISLLTGFLSVLISAASNPYLSSFDFLFALSIIPLILNTSDKARQG